jgi:SSS family solute:Na+ symporter
MINVKSALDAWWKLASIFSGGMLGLFLLAAFTEFKNNRAILTGTIIGILIILYLSAGPILFGDTIPGADIHNYLAIVLGTLAIFIIGFLMAWLMKRNKLSTT